MKVAAAPLPAALCLLLQSPIPGKARADRMLPADNITDTGEQRREMPKTKDTLPDSLCSRGQINDDCFAGHLEQVNEN